MDQLNFLKFNLDLLEAMELEVGDDHDGDGAQSPCVFTMNLIRCILKLHVFIHMFSSLSGTCFGLLKGLGVLSRLLADLVMLRAG